MTTTKESVGWSKRLNLRLAGFPQTDLGNAERFVERFRGKLLQCSNVGWYCWDGKRWIREGAEERLQDAVHQTVRAIQDEAEVLVNSDRDVSVIKNGWKVLMSKTLADWGRANHLYILGIWSQRKVDNDRFDELRPRRLFSISPYRKLFVPRRWAQASSGVA